MSSPSLSSSSISSLHPAGKLGSAVRPTEALARFAVADWRAGLCQLAGTLAAFAGLWTLAWFCLEISYALTLVVSGAAALALVRLFIIQHDCAHQSYLPNRRANDIVGALLGVLTLTPHAQWRREHSLHHASSGNLDERGIGDIDTLTVREYLALGPLQRMWYRIYRHAFVLLVIGPLFQFYLRNRFPVPMAIARRREWISVIGTNVALVVMLWIAAETIGLSRFMLVHLPITWLGGSIGLWLFYVQHQFERTYWARDDEWNFEAASVVGSSYLDLPPFLRWCTGNIGLHHVHHLAPRIPNYRLSHTLDVHPVLARATRLTLTDGMKSLRLKLWDEDSQQLVRIP